MSAAHVWQYKRIVKEERNSDAVLQLSAAAWL
jgi:hypothetical protein